jgi:hypothetical protein
MTIGFMLHVPLASESHLLNRLSRSVGGVSETNERVRERVGAKKPSRGVEALHTAASD